MTGRGAGLCAGFPTPGFAQPLFRGGRYWARRYPFGLGYRGVPPAAGFGRAYYGRAYGPAPRYPLGRWPYPRY